MQSGVDRFFKLHRLYGSDILQNTVRTGMPLILQDHTLHYKSTLRKARIAVDKLNEENLSVLLEGMPAAQKRTSSRIING